MKKKPPRKRKSKDIRAREFLTAEEVESMRQAISTKDRCAQRDSTMILICYRHAFRPSELIKLEWDQIDFSKKSLSKSDQRGNRTTHALEDDEIEALLALKTSNKTSPTIFCSETEKPISSRTVHAIVAKAGQRAGLPFSVHPEMLRHAKAHQVVAQGATAKALQSIMGYNNKQSAKLYLKRIEEEHSQRQGLDLQVPAERGYSSTACAWRLSALRESGITLQIPASACNMGPGLDTIGLALNLYVRITCRLLDENDPTIPLVKLKGGFIQTSKQADQSDLIYTALKKIWQQDTNLFRRLRFEVNSEVPLGAGLGVAGAVILGTVWASCLLEERLPNRGELLARCFSVEGHPETMAASLLGQVVVCGERINHSGFVTQQIPWPQDWRIIAIVPPFTLTTPQSRRVLPERVSLSDAIFNLKRLSLLVAGITNQDELAVKEALHDRLHEPYRRHLVPHLTEIKNLLASQPIIGCILSGGGSSVLVVVNARFEDRVSGLLDEWSHTSNAQVLRLQVDSYGLREL